MLKVNRKVLIGYTVGPIGSSLLSLALIPTMAWSLTPDRIADYTLLILFCSISLLLSTLGADQYLIRNYYETNNKVDLSNRAYSVSLISNLSLVVLVFIFDATNIISLSSELSLKEVLVLLCIIIISNFNRFNATLLRLEENALSYSISNLIPKFLTIFSFLFLYYNSQPISIYYLIVTLLLGHVATFIFMQIKVNFSFIKRYYFSVSKYRDVFSYGTPMLFAGLAYWGLQAVDRVMLSEFGLRDELATYSIAIQLAGLAMLIQSLVSIIWTPMALKVINSNSKHDSINFEIKVEEIALLFSKLILLLILIINSFSWLFPLFLPHEYKDIYKITALCMLPPFLYAISECTVIGIYISKKTNFALLASLIAMTVNITLNYILIPISGLFGCAIATAISFLTFFSLRSVFSIYVWKKFNLFKLIQVLVVCLLVSLIPLFFRFDLFLFINTMALMITIFLYRKDYTIIVKHVLSR